MLIVVQGPDSGGARYTLLGFVQHMGTMRSGHYEACVQRGLSLADSPAVQALLRKHGIAFPESADAASNNKLGEKHTKAAAKTINSAAPHKVQAKAQPAVSSANTAKGDKQGLAVNDVQPHAATNGKAVAVLEDWEGSDSSSASAPGSNQSPPAVASHKGPLPVESSESEVDTRPLETEATAAQVSGESANPESPEKDQSGQDDQPSLEGKTGAGQEPEDMPRTWYCISDAHVRVIPEADVLSREAYILMYMRIA